jgi:hypothetical protein
MKDRKFCIKLLIVISRPKCILFHIQAIDGYWMLFGMFGATEETIQAIEAGRKRCRRAGVYPPEIGNKRSIFAPNSFSRGDRSEAGYSGAGRDTSIA